MAQNQPDFAGMWSGPGSQRWLGGAIGALAVLGLGGCGGATTSEGASPRPSFVAVGVRGTIVSSPDATTWTPQVSGVTVTLTSVAASSKLLVAVGAGGTILTSARGTTWTARRSGTDVDLADVVFNGEQFVAVGGAWSGEAVTLTSVDGVSWAAIESPPAYSFHTVAIAGGTVLAAAVTPSKEVPMALDNVVLEYVLPSTSSRGSWRERDLPRFNDSLLMGDETLTVGSWDSESTLSRSTDGQIWTTQNLPGVEARAIASDGSSLVVLGHHSALSSPDGAAWSERDLPVDNGWLLGVTYGAPAFVAVGSGGGIFTSPDGATWTRQASASDADLADVIHGPG